MHDPPPDRGLAGERTTLAWQRSGLSFIVLGGLVARAGVEAGTSALAIVAGSVTALVGMSAWAHGRRAYRRDRRALATGRIRPHVRVVRATAAATTLVAAFAFALVVALH